MSRVVSLFDVDDATGFGPVRDMTVSRVSGDDVGEFCRRWHYTGTRGADGWNFGLWDGYTLVGVVAYNIPTLSTCASVFGVPGDRTVLHMGRLVCADDAPRNVESRLIARSLRLLKQGDPAIRAVITYAAQDQGHIGYVYQATNALYIGEGRPTWVWTDSEGRRRTTYINGRTRSTEKALAAGWSRHKSLPTHRYIYLVGSKTERKEALRLLRYTPQPYPKATP